MHSCLSASQTSGLPFREDPTQFRKLSSILHTHILLLVSISYHVALLFFSISYHTVLLFCFYKLYIVTYFFVFLCYMYMYYSVLTSTGKKVFTKLMECYIIMSEFFFCMSSYATAGDHFTVSPQCIPMGTFKLDLTGSPFVVSQETQWTLNASSPPGTSQKQSIFITNSSK